MRSNWSWTQNRLLSFLFFLIFCLFISKVCQLNTVLQNVENSKAQLGEIGVLVNNENAEIETDGRKEQTNTSREDKMIHDLNESIRQAEQQLRQAVSTTFNRLLWLVIDLTCFFDRKMVVNRTLVLKNRPLKQLYQVFVQKPQKLLKMR